MALNTNSKAYQGLLDKGYTAEQIQQMANNVQSGQSYTQAINNVKAQGVTQSTGPADGYATASERNRATGGTEFGEPSTPTQTTPEVKQETEIKQTETQGSTVPEIKQEGALKPQTQEYYNQESADAQSKIVSNLNQYKQTNPEYFTDYESFKKNFSYNARNDIQKQTLDTWYKGYEEGLQLSNTPVNDLYTQYKNGNLSTAQLENLRVANPTKYTELQNQINKGTIIAAYDDDSAPTTMNFQELAYQMIANSLNMMNSGDYGTSNIFSDYEEKMNSPEMLSLSDQTTALEEDIKNIQDDIASMTKEVEKEYEGTGASRAKINAIVADRTYDLQLQLRTLNNEYTKYATQYNNRANQYQNEFQLQLQEYQLNMQARNQQMSELGFAMDLMNFETNEQKAQREWDYWVKQQEYTNGNINSKDYQTRYKAALTSVQNLLSQYEGIPMQRSAEQMADDILKAIDNGSNLGAELTKINKQIQQKPEYKYLYNNTFGTTSKGVEGIYNIGGTEYVKYNGQLITSDDFNKKYGGLGKKINYTVVSDDKLKTWSDGRAGTYGSFMANPKNDDDRYIGECGKFVNNYLEEIGAGRPFGNEDIETRKGWINSDAGKVGTIAVFDYNHKSSDGINHGHVGIVISAPDKNGDFWVKDANFGSDGKIQTRKVNLKDVSLKGFIDPTLNPDGSKGTVGTNTATLTSNNGTTTETNTYNIGHRDYVPERVGMYDAYLNHTEGRPTDSMYKSWGNGDAALGLAMFEAEVKDYQDKTGAGTLEKRKNDEINKLRSELHQTQAYKDYNQMQSYFKKIENSANITEPDAYSDMSLIFAYMKMLDPNSIVRESEYATAAEAGNVPTQILSLYNQAVEGQKLTDGQRKSIFEASVRLMDGATELYNQTLDDYTLLINYGGDASKLGKKGTYYSDDYINKYGQTTQDNPFQKWIGTGTPNTAKKGQKRPLEYSSSVTLSNGMTFER